MAEGNDSDAQAANAAGAQAASATDANAANDPAPPTDAADNDGASSPRIGSLLPMLVDRPAYHPGADAFDPIESSGPAESPRPRWRRYAPLAAGIALAAVVGALAGAATTTGLLRDTAAPAPAAAPAAASPTTIALQVSVARLESEIATLKAGVNSAQRSASANFGKLTESVDRLDHRLTQTGARAASDITGSVSAAKPEAPPPLADGWRLRDFYAGRAVVEARNGRLFEVGPGSNLPGLGRVETIKRQDGRVVVVTRNGIITAALEPRRPPYRLPYRY